MILITGDYNKIKSECEKIYQTGFFDFNFLYVSESERFREIDRFLFESRHTLRFENEYKGNVVIDISEWNNMIINTYFEAFMYFIKDNKNKYDCVFILNERCSKDMREKLKDFFGEVKEVQMPALNEKKKNRIGFVLDDGKEVNNVRG